ncbi:MAG: Leucinerich repeat protein-like protein, partial [Segetibacter sp.]|nr:Leucinerich repeat protein-like protein [Segetibacter sp.]
MKLFLLLFASFCFITQIQSQTIITAAGNGTMVSGGDGGPFSKATFAGGARMIYDKSGNLYLSERRTGRIRKVDAVSGIISTFVSGFYVPMGMAFDRDEKFMYVAENSCVYQVNMATRAVSVFAGIPNQLCSAFFLCGEGGLAVNAILDNPHGVAVDSIGNVYIADNSNSRVRKVDIFTRIITTYAGGGGCNCVGLGDGGPANKGTLLFPSDVLFDKNGDLIISDGGLHNIRKVDSKTGIISTIAGGTQGGAWGYSGDGGPAVNARLHSPSGIFLDKTDNLYIAEELNYVVRKIDNSGVISTVAGNGAAGYSGDCGPALKAQMNTPLHAVVTPTGSILIADYHNGVFREVINSAPNVITASSNSLCVNTAIALKNSAQGGVWQSSNTAVAKVGADGVVTALSEGKVDISYHITSGCNNNSSTASLTVYPTPNRGEIKGTATICEGSSVVLSNAVTTGVWSSSDSLVAFPNADGRIKGIAAGTATIRYTVSNAQCSNTDSLQIVVNPLPKSQPLSGDTTVCVNSTTALTHPTAGGVWSIGNVGIAS